jgi:hypothetical protein
MNRLRIVLLALACATGFSQTTPRLLDRSHFFFVHAGSGARVDFSSSIATLRESLGSPKTDFEKPDGQGFKRYTWDGLELRVLPDSDIILRATVTKEAFVAEGGITIGTPINLIRTAWGPPSIEGRGYLEYLYSNMSETWALRFAHRNDAVSLMQLGRED